MNLVAELISIVPNENPPPFIKEVFSVIGHYSNHFLKTRKKSYLLKLSKARYLVKKKLSKEITLFNERFIYIKFLAVKFQKENSSRKVLGILGSFTLNPKRERFGKEHLLVILKKILSGIHILEESIHLSLDQDTNQLVYYLEIEKIRGKHLSFKECWKLKKRLVQEIKDGIEYSSPDLWSPENEEQIFKDILRLNREVNSTNDLPHVSISLKEQLSEAIRFNVILVRIVKKKNLSFEKKLSDLGMGYQIHLENKISFKKNHVKQTLVFSLEVSNILFYRKNYKIDLLKARQYVCIILQQILGEFRDYNGALLSKQAEQFNTLMDALSIQEEDLSDFESLFYSLAPANIQLLFSTEAFLELSRAFYNLKNEKENRSFSLKYENSKDFFFVMIKTESDQYDSIFSNLPTDSLVAKVTKVIDQKKYHCLVQMHPNELSLMGYIRRNLEDIEKNSKLLPRKEINLAFSYLPPSIHPHLTTDTRSLTLCKALFEGLTRMNLKDQFEFALAEKVEVSSCRTIYHFKLRSSNWSNGREVTSQDFAKAWKKAISHGSNCIRIKNFFSIKNAKKVYEGSACLEQVGIHTPSKKELTIELEYPMDCFLQLVADPIFSPIHNIYDEEPSIFNGPFTLQKISDHKIEFIKNKCYWDKSNVGLEKMNALLVESSDETYTLFREGKLDWIGSPFHFLPKQARKESVQISKTEFPFWLICNTKNPKLASVKIRQALSYAIDREKLIKKASSFQKSLYGIIPDEFSLINAKDFSSENMMEKASTLFEEGLEEVKLKRNIFEINMTHSRSFEQYTLAHFLKHSWEKRFNIRVNLMEISWDSHWNNIFNKEHEIAGFFFYAPHREIIHFIDFFQSLQNSYTGWDNKNYQEYLTLAKRSKNETERIFFLRKAEEILNYESPIIPVYTYAPMYLKNQSLNKFLISKFGYVDFKWEYLDE